MDSPRFVYPPYVDGHLAVVNSATLDTMHGILCGHVCSRLSGGRIAGSDGNSVHDFSRKCWSAVHGSHIHTSAVISCFLGSSRPDGGKVMSRVLSVHIFLVLKDFEHLFTCLWAILFFRETPVEVIVH